MFGIRHSLFDILRFHERFACPLSGMTEPPPKLFSSAQLYAARRTSDAIDGEVIAHDTDLSRAAHEQAAAAQDQAAAALRRVMELEAALRAAGIKP